MKTAAEYAELASEQIIWGGDQDAVSQALRFGLAHVFATLALAAATLEATSPPWLEAETKLFYCRTEWIDERSAIQGTHSAVHDGNPHRCIYAAGHEREEPHYCRCGSEL